MSFDSGGFYPVFSKQELRVLFITRRFSTRKPAIAPPSKNCLSAIAEHSGAVGLNRGFERRQIFAGAVARDYVSVDVNPKASFAAAAIVGENDVIPGSRLSNHNRGRAGS